MGWFSKIGSYVKNNLSEVVHGALDVAGFIPGFGAVADLANAAIYAAEGDFVNAGMSALAAIPGIGDAAAVASKGMKVTKSLKLVDKAGDAKKALKAVKGKPVKGGKAVTGGKGLKKSKKTTKRAKKKTNKKQAIDKKYSRPSGYRKGVRDKVWEKAKRNKDGKVIDPVTKKPIDPNQSWDMGHKPGYEFRKHQESAQRRGISRKQFLDEYNNPKHYRPELPSSNRSHKGENRSKRYYGP